MIHYTSKSKMVTIDITTAYVTDTESDGDVHTHLIDVTIENTTSDKLLSFLGRMWEVHDVILGGRKIDSRDFIGKGATLKPGEVFTYDFPIVVSDLALITGKMLFYVYDNTGAAASTVYLTPVTLVAPSRLN